MTMQPDQASVPASIPQPDQFPAFFRQAPVLLIRDPLAQFLGASPDGLMAYRYVDAVKLAGHSCPTVASAFLMVLRGLDTLYGGDVPVRGEIDVIMRGGREEGATGVMANVAMLLTGAAPETGFHGLGPLSLFSRHELLSFGGGDIGGELRLRRRDNGLAVDVACNPSIAPWPEEMQALLPLVVRGQANETLVRRFGELWQDRVKRILVDLVDDPRLITVEEL